MEFLNGIVEKLAPIHEKILDLTNPLTLTIEEYVPKLAPFHDQLIYVLLLTVVLFFGLLRKAVRRGRGARPPRRSGPAMWMSQSSATPPSPSRKPTVRGRVLDYDAQSFISQSMGSAAAFGTVQQPPAAGQSYGAQGFASQPMDPAAAFDTVQQLPAVEQSYDAQDLAPQPMDPATLSAPEQRVEVLPVDAPHIAEKQTLREEKESPASWKEPDAPTAEERLARLYPNVEFEFQNLYINLYADQELTTDFSDLRNSVFQRILQNQSPLPLFDPGQGSTRDLLLAHIANSALDVIKKLSEDRQDDRAKFNLHEQELCKIYRCVLYRLNDSGLIDEETAERLIQEARDLTSNR